MKSAGGFSAGRIAHELHLSEPDVWRSISNLWRLGCLLLEQRVEVPTTRLVVLLKLISLGEKPTPYGELAESSPAGTTGSTPVPSTTKINKLREITSLG